MALSANNIRDAIFDKIHADADNLYEPHTSVPKPDTGDPDTEDALKALFQYIAQAVVEEIDTNAELNSATTGSPGVID